MTQDTVLLMGTAASLGFIHTILGPDHYLPFIVMSKARNWKIFKTILITFLCGLGHVLSSVVLGLLGVILGTALFSLEVIESFRGDIAAWFLMIFGFTYFIWALRGLIRRRTHEHSHGHHDQDEHVHLHRHIGRHSHAHNLVSTASLTPWILFIIFVFGPCEPLIPLLMYPAAKANFTAVVLVSFVFGFITMLTMIVVVLVCSFGLSKLPLGKLEKYSHTLAGFTIFLCGIAIVFLGL